MTPEQEQASTAWIRELQLGSGWSDAQASEAKQQLAALIERATEEEREACAATAETFMRLCGSSAAEQAARQIRARSADQQ